MATGLVLARELLRGATSDQDKRNATTTALRSLRGEFYWSATAARERAVLRRYLDLLARKRLASPSFGRTTQPTIAAIVARDIDALTAVVRANREAAKA